MSVKKNTPDFLKHNGLSFTTIINQTMHLIPDDGALGIYCYLASKSEDWDICYKHLQNRFQKGRDYIQKKMDLLKKIGLIKKQSFRDEKGIITHWETSLINYIPTHNTENPYCGEVIHSIHITENPESGKPRCLEKQALLNKRDIPIKENIKIKDSSRDIDHKEIDRFEEFYQAYPRKEGKKVAAKAWCKNKLNDISDFIILNLIERVKEDYSYREKKHIPLPATYLNGERWQDEITPHIEEKKQSTNKNVYNSNKPRQETSYASVESQSTSWVPPEESLRREREYRERQQKYYDSLTTGATHGSEAEVQNQADHSRANTANTKSLYPSMRKATEYLPSR